MKRSLLFHHPSVTHCWKNCQCCLLTLLWLCLHSLPVYLLWLLIGVLCICQAKRKPNDAKLWNFILGFQVMTAWLDAYSNKQTSWVWLLDYFRHPEVALSWCEFTQTGGLNCLAISHVPHTFRGRPGCRAACTNQITFFCFSHWTSQQKTAGWEKALEDGHHKRFHFLQCLSQQCGLLSRSTCAYI